MRAVWNLAWIIHEATRFLRKAGPAEGRPRASPFTVVNPAQSAIPSVLRSFAESTTEKGSGERIRRFMNSPDWPIDKVIFPQSHWYEFLYNTMRVASIIDEFQQPNL